MTRPLHSGARRWFACKEECLLLQTISPDYRQPVWESLQRAVPVPIAVIAGDTHLAESQVTRHTAAVPLIHVRHSFLMGRRLLIQWLPIRRAVNARVLVCELNPRILSSWMLLLVRKLLRRRTVVWGHAISRSVTWRPDPLRQAFRWLADAVVVYTETEARAVRDRMPRAVVYAAPNAIVDTGEMVARTSLKEPRAFVYVGRLSPEKKPALLIDAFALALPRLSGEIRLKIAGSGPLAAELRSLADETGVASRVDFLGHVTDIAGLRPLYASALASVCPGFAGLSLTQSLGFGVPMIIADREPHAPEIEAAKPNLNCRFFSSDDPSALADALVEFEQNAQQWVSRAGSIADACRRGYSVSAMTSRLADAIAGNPV